MDWQPLCVRAAQGKGTDGTALRGGGLVYIEQGDTGTVNITDSTDSNVTDIFAKARTHPCGSGLRALEWLTQRHLCGLCTSPYRQYPPRCECTLRPVCASRVRSVYLARIRSRSEPQAQFPSTGGARLLSM